MHTPSASAFTSVVFRRPNNRLFYLRIRAMFAPTVIARNVVGVIVSDSHVNSLVRTGSDSVRTAGSVTLIPV